MNDVTSDQQFFENFVEQHFPDAKWIYGHTVAKVHCPGPLHDNGDQDPSATIKIGHKRTLVYKCYAGDDTDDVLEALNLKYSDLDLPGRERPRPKRPEPQGEDRGVELRDVVAAYVDYQGDDDLAMLYVLLAAVASHELPDDPLWPAIIGAPSSGKTEALNGILGLPDVHPVSKLSAAGLMSASSRRDRGKESTGGLLKVVGESGILAFKDFTTVLSDNPDSQTEVLAILREVYDGRVDRHAGSDGGTSFTWSGKVTAIIACTEALDEAHAVRAVMGERFVMIRQGVDAGNDRRRGTARRAMRGSSEARERRRNLHRLIQMFLSSERVLIGDQQHALTSEVEDRLADLATGVARARSGVVRNRYSRDIEAVPEPEFPARLAKQLAKLWRSLGVIGLPPEGSWQVVNRVAADSIPLLRWRCLSALIDPDVKTTTDILKQAGNPPRRTMLRALEDLEVLRVIERTSDENGSGIAATWKLDDEWRSMIAARRPLRQPVESVPAIRSYCLCLEKKGIREHPYTGTPSQSAGTLCTRCGLRKSDIPMLRTITGCEVAEWLAAVEKGIPGWMDFRAVGLLAECCDECLEFQVDLGEGPNRPLVRRAWDGEQAEVTIPEAGVYLYEGDRPQVPLAVDTESLTAYYVCGFGHAWVTAHADLDGMHDEYGDIHEYPNH